MVEINKMKWSILVLTCVAMLAAGVGLGGFGPWKASARAQAVQERKNHECDIYSWAGCWQCYSEDGFWCGVTLEYPYQPGDCIEFDGRDCIRTYFPHISFAISLNFGGSVGSEVIGV